MRLAFFGGAEFSWAVADAALAAGHSLAAVYTRPPARGGRGMRLRPSFAQARAEALGIAVATPARLDAAAVADFVALAPDAALVCAYGLKLPEAMLVVPCVNVHLSLLPRWRGAAPVERAMMAGEPLGVSVMAMAAGLDTGAVLAAALAPETDAMNAGEAKAALAVRGGAMAMEVLAADGVAAVAQDDAKSCWASPVRAEEGKLDWQRSAQDLARQVRALAPLPGAWCWLGDARVKVLRASPVPSALPSALRSALPGEAQDDRLTIACGEGALRLEEVQRAGSRAMAAEAMLRGAPFPRGSRAR